MGKARNYAKSGKSSHQNSSARVAKRKNVIRRQHSQTAKQPFNTGPGKTHNDIHHSNRNTSNEEKPSAAKLKVPFSKNDNVLLVGEGDFSFALSLATHYRIKNLIATCFDSNEALVSKYPDAEATIAKLKALDAPKAINVQRVGQVEQEEWQGFSSNSSMSSDGGFNTDDASNAKINSAASGSRRVQTQTHYSIDASKLSSLHKKTFKTHSPFTKIVFNFPHVGGISTDVNRQVRANQELLVGFFNAAKTLLATPTNPVKPAHSSPNNDIYASSEDGWDADEDESHTPLTHGSILVSLFEGEPYTLWNIRDLARHCGLKVVESFKFPWAAYPGYRHARTIGDITHGQDRSHEGKRKGAWRGEERDARCYVLTLKDAEGPYPAAGLGKKRRQDEDNDSD